MSPMTPRQRLDAALQRDDHNHAVYELAVQLRDEGTPRLEIYVVFEGAMAACEDDDPRCDSLVDALDGIWGGPWAKGRELYDTELTDEEVRANRPEDERG